MKKLYRNSDNKVLAGLIGGFGEYTDIDPTILRVIFVIFVVFTGVFPGVLVYIILIFVVPERPNGRRYVDVESEDGEPDGPPHRPWS